MLSHSSARVSERVIWEIIGQACRGRGPFARGSGRPPAAIRQAPFKASIGIAKKTVNLPWRTREGCIIGFDVNRTRTALGCAARNNTLRNWTITIDLPAYLYLPACLRTHRLLTHPQCPGVGTYLVPLPLHLSLRHGDSIRLHLASRGWRVVRSTFLWLAFPVNTVQSESGCEESVLKPISRRMFNTEIWSLSLNLHRFCAIIYVKCIPRIKSSWSESFLLY